MSYLAFVRIGAGGSWSRHSDKAQAIANIRHIIVSDWASLFNVYGKPVEVTIYDLGDREWKVNHRGVMVDVNTGEEIEPLEVLTTILPPRPRRRA
jgi:hypothetical protein